MPPISSRQLDNWLPYFTAIIDANPYQRQQYVRDLIAHDYEAKREAAKEVFELILSQVRIHRNDKRQYLFNVINQLKSRGDIHDTFHQFLNQIINKYFSRAFS